MDEKGRKRGKTMKGRERKRRGRKERGRLERVKRGGNGAKL